MRPIGVLVVAAVMATAVIVGAADGQDARPLPATEALYRAVRDNLVRAERVAHLYAFKERRTDVHTNPFGRIGTGGTRAYEVYPSSIRRLTYRRLTERDGVPLAATELAARDREYRTRVVEVQRQLATRSAEVRQRQDDDAARARERRQRRVEDVVEALRFDLAGRTVYRGVPAIVVSFVPKPGAKPETREGRMAVNFQGMAWIDEAASEVMHVEATSIGDITFGFGLAARLGKGAAASMTRRRVAGDLWMPTQITLSGRGRAAVFRALVLDFAIDWFDYRRLAGDSATPFLDSGVQREPGGSPQ
jgi:hypothetical protein